MKRIKNFFASMFILILVFLCLFTPTSNANFFTDRGENGESEIEKSIDSEDGGIFEKIIAKMIGRYC